uniref:Uncharacterized protein n=1 Tax=Streptomyces griseochromogenes TaxID=68214 RepID=M1GT27_9ACTN|nr:hypothetical protein EX-BLS-5 [Streptomyces griseochromogenes]
MASCSGTCMVESSGAEARWAWKKPSSEAVSRSGPPWGLRYSTSRSYSENHAFRLSSQMSIRWPRTTSLARSSGAEAGSCSSCGAASSGPAPGDWGAGVWSVAPCCFATPLNALLCTSARPNSSFRLFRRSFLTSEIPWVRTGESPVAPWGTDNILSAAPSMSACSTENFVSSSTTRPRDGDASVSPSAGACAAGTNRRWSGESGSGLKK